MTMTRAVATSIHAVSPPLTSGTRLPSPSRQLMHLDLLSPCWPEYEGPQGRPTTSPSMIDRVEVVHSARGAPTSRPAWFASRRCSPLHELPDLRLQLSRGPSDLGEDRHGTLEVGHRLVPAAGIVEE